MQGIKHIIFDLGGVLLNIDYQLTEDAFVKLGLSDFAARYTQAQQIDFFSKYETGQITTAEFVATLKTWLPVVVADAQIIEAWNAMLLDFPLRRLQILQQLQLHYDIVLLSNTNELHEIAFNQKLKEVCGYNQLSVFFDRVYYSHRIGKRKPDTQTFEYVIADTGFDPKHTLFIDDSPQHIAGASSIGIQTIWLEKGMSIEEHIFKPKPVYQ
jgi:HAD superfamily hydrolase (TIGR01509 family)